MNTLSIHPVISIIKVVNGVYKIKSTGQTLSFTDPDGAPGFLELIFSLFDGWHARADIVNKMRMRFPDKDCDDIIQFLIDRSIIVHSSHGASDDYASILDFHIRTFGLSSDQPERKVALIGTGRLAEALTETLQQLNVDAASATNITAENSLIVACSDHLDHARFRELNAQAISVGRPILFCCINRYELVIGPLVEPGGSACFECVHHRMRMAAATVGEFDGEVNASRRQEAPASLVLARWAASIAALTLVHRLSGLSLQHPTGQIVRVDALTGVSDVHRCLKLPRCPVCGPGRAEKPVPAIYELSA